MNDDKHFIKTLEQVQQEYPYATVMTIKEYFDNIKSRTIIYSDGFGYYHDGETETTQRVNFDLKYNEYIAGIYYPYVCWYNN